MEAEKDSVIMIMTAKCLPPAIFAHVQWQTRQASCIELARLKLKYKHWGKQGQGGDADYTNAHCEHIAELVLRLREATVSTSELHKKRIASFQVFVAWHLHFFFITKAI